MSGLTAASRTQSPRHPSAPSAPAGSFTLSHPLQCASKLAGKKMSNLKLRIPTCQSLAQASSEEAQCETKSPAELAPHLLLGSIDHASDRELISKLGVTAVLNVSTQCSNYFPDQLQYLRIPVQDTTNSTLMPYFKQAAEFIGEFFFSCLFIKPCTCPYLALL